MEDGITVRAGDLEPLEFEIGAGGRTNLDDLQSAELYGRFLGATTNQIDGVQCVVADSASMLLRFNPDGAGPAGTGAFDVTVPPGSKRRLRCYVKLTWTDGQDSRHPAKDDGSLDVWITPNYEGGAG